MTVMVPIGEDAKMMAEEMVQDGRFASIEDAIAAGLTRLTFELLDLDDIPPEHRAGVLRGLEDSAAGRVKDADEVFDHLIAKYQALSDEASARS